jgi:nitrous oxidase accessory protein NosD
VFLRNAHNATIAANHLVGATDDGVDLRGVTRSTVVDNRVCDVGDHPLVQRRGAGNNTVANNVFGC